MPIFRCTSCGCIDNTALTHYWQTYTSDAGPRCSVCDPSIATWHNRFTQRSADGCLLGEDGFLYHEGQDTRTKMVGRIEDGKVVFTIDLGPDEQLFLHMLQNPSEPTERLRRLLRRVVR